MWGGFSFFPARIITSLDGFFPPSLGEFHRDFLVNFRKEGGDSTTLGQNSTAIHLSRSGRGMQGPR